MDSSRVGGIQRYEVPRSSSSQQRSILFLFQSVCTFIPAPSQAISIWICGPYKLRKSRQHIRLRRWRPGGDLFRQLHYRRGISAGLCSIQQRGVHWRRSWSCGSIRPLFSLLRQGGPFKCRRAFSGIMGWDFFSTRRSRPVRCDPNFTWFCVWVECDIKSNRSGSVAPAGSSRQCEGAVLPGL